MHTSSDCPADQSYPMLTRLLQEQGFVTIDGGLATELEWLFGLKLDAPLWSGSLLLTQQGVDRIRDAHRAFVHRGGADVVCSASYHVWRQGLLQAGVESEQEADRVITSSVELARSVCHEADRRVLCAASLGPFAVTLWNASEYTGDYNVAHIGDEGCNDAESEQRLRAFHAQRLPALLAAGPDVVAVETFPRLDEALIVLQLLQEARDSREGATFEVWVTFVCTSETTLSSGESFATAMERVMAFDCVAAAGINCTDPRLVTPLLQSCDRTWCRKPFIVYPNSGETWDMEAHVWLPTAAEQQGQEPQEGRSQHDGAVDAVAPADAAAGVAQYVPQWWKLGVRLVGGCCRVRPDHVAAIRSALQTSCQGSGQAEQRLTLLSFGYKWGAPKAPDVAVVVNARHLPNPPAALRKRHTGLHARLQTELWATEGAEAGLDGVRAAVLEHVQASAASGSDGVSIGIGCHAGKHRSVAAVERLVRELGAMDGLVVTGQHRDVHRSASKGGKESSRRKRQ